MKNKRSLLTILIVSIIVISLTTVLVWAMKGETAESSLNTAAGTGFTYQGYLEDSGSPANDIFDFTFELYDAEVSGTFIISTTTDNVVVEDGIFTVILDFGGTALNGESRWLEIGVRPGGEGGTYTYLTERQPLTPVPYALLALDTLPLENIITVAKSGGDFTSIQAAIDSITDASFYDRYLVFVAPGSYDERVTMKSYVDVAGAGRDLTEITAAGGISLNGDSATLTGAGMSTLRDISIRNTGNADYAIGIYNNNLTNGAFNIRNVDIQASDSNNYSKGIYSDSGGTIKIFNLEVNVDISLSGSAVAIENNGINFAVMDNITAISYSHEEESIGIVNTNVTSVSMKDISVSAQGVTWVMAIENSNSAVHMRNIKAISYGDNTFGIENSGTVDMSDVYVQAEGVYAKGIVNAGDVDMINVESQAVGIEGGIGMENSNAMVEMHHVNSVGEAEAENHSGIGMNNLYSSVSIQDSVIEGKSTDGYGYAFYVVDGTTATLTNVSLRGSGASFFGIYAYSPSIPTDITLHNTILESEFTTGIHGNGYPEAFTLTADECIFNGEVQAANNAIFNIANSQFLDGAVPIGIADYNCFNNYDGLYAAYACP